MKSLLLALILVSPLAHAAEAPRAFYEVPVSKELSPYANYEIIYYSKAVRGNVIELSYMLPVELTGKETIVSFTGKVVNGQEPSVFRGPNGTMKCGLREMHVQTCAVKYKGLEVDMDKVSEILDLRKVDSEEKDGRLKVAALFREGGGDIGGIITYVNESSAR